MFVVPLGEVPFVRVEGFGQDCVHVLVVFATFRRLHEPGFELNLGSLGQIDFLERPEDAPFVDCMHV
jgi:hypothetical protein